MAPPTSTGAIFDIVAKIFIQERPSPLARVKKNRGDALLVNTAV